MASFLITTQESVEGKYIAEAETKEEALAMFGDNKIDWENVTQIEYGAYEVSIDKIRRLD